MSYTVELVTPETPLGIIEQLFARSGEIIHLDAGREQYCGGVEGSPDAKEDVEDLFPQKKSVAGGSEYDREDFYIQRRYVALDPIAGVVAYCDIRYPVTEKSEGYPDFAIYKDDSKERPDQTVMIVYVALSCSFTMSNEKVGDKSVREIIADKKKADASLPNAGKFIKQEIGRQLVDEFGVDRVIFVSLSIDSAVAQHRKNGGKFFKEEEGFSIFGALKSPATKGNVLQTFMENAMSSNEFLFSRTIDTLVKRLEREGFYVVYPPPGGGRRRRNKKTLRRRRRRTYKKKTARRRL